jgi:N-acetyl sugar amidotransferase
MPIWRALKRVRSEEIKAMASFEEGGKTFVEHPHEGSLEVKYGLPPEVKFCTNCVISNQRPSSAAEFRHRPDSKKTTIGFDDAGMCDACRYAERKNAAVDWREREAKLCDRYRSRNGSYDCLVPGSGGKDSVFASHTLKAEYGMHPLTCTWAPHLYTNVGWRNFENWIHKGGFDNYLFTPNGEIHRKLTRLAYINLLHPFQPFILGQKNFAPKVAQRFDLPLVFYGENEAEYGNPIGENTEAQRRAEYFSAETGDLDSIYLGGVPLSRMPEHGIEPTQLEPYLPADPAALDAGEIEVHYLGYYLKWTPQQNYYYAVEHIQFEANSERTEGTYSKYNSIDDKTDPFHYWTTLVKFGIGRATYDASQEIRNRHIERDEAVALVRRYDEEFPRKYFPEFLEYLSLDEEEFFDIADRFRSPHLWRKTNEGWELRHKVA